MGKALGRGKREDGSGVRGLAWKKGDLDSVAVLVSCGCCYKLLQT